MPFLDIRNRSVEDFPAGEAAISIRQADVRALRV
jgi:hypothetical protein